MGAGGQGHSGRNLATCLTFPLTVLDGSERRERRRASFVVPALLRSELCGAIQMRLQDGLPSYSH